MAGQIIMKGADPKKFATGSKAMMMLLVRRCAEKLQEHYPRHIWSVAASPDNSIIAIKALNVDEHYGYVLHTRVVQEDANLDCVRLAGGEVLERGGQATGKLWDGNPSSHVDLTGAKAVRKADEKQLIKKVIR